MNVNLTEKDRQQIREHGLTEETVRKQLDIFEHGVPYTVLDRAATIGDGVRGMTERERERAKDAHANATAEGRFLKFVPASGAASRMFKLLQSLRGRNDEELTGDELKRAAASGDEAAEFGLRFFQDLRKFAFIDGVAVELEKAGEDLDELLDSQHYGPILRAVLDEDRLGLGLMPKGLVPFHKVGEDVRTPVAEQLLEAIEYVKDRDGVARIHFTVAPEFEQAFAEEARVVAQRYPSTNFEITFSVQSPSTDTIAVDLDNQPFRDADGRLVFRPGGHGALLHNLGQLDAEIIYVKNIDNVVPPRLAFTTYEEKRELGGLMAKLLDARNQALHDLEHDLDEARLDEIKDWAQDELELKFAEWEEMVYEDRKNRLYDTLNRPMRICGMVRNLGDPGGGPFWVQRGNGDIDRQIVETSQIDLDNENQRAIHASSTHFNPVDLVLAIRDHNGRKYELERHVDEDTYFISQKSKDGRELKALELPGLWNGAMADWLTLFVEVPGETFNPVKTVNDLLNDEHQGETSST